MRRKRVPILFAILLSVSTIIFWLGSVLAATIIVNNNGLRLNTGESENITSSMLLSEDDVDENATVTYTLSITPLNGNLVLSDTGGITTLMPISQFLQSDIDQNFLVYNHTSLGAEIDDTFEFTVTTGVDEITNTFAITINQPPTINDSLFSIAENEPFGTSVGIVMASDANTEDNFTYSILSSEPSPAFAIGSSSGEITVSDSALLDFETTPIFTLTVEVEDSGLLTDTAEITINVLNINEPPTLNDDSFSLPENSSNGTSVGTLAASDPDASETFNYTITASDPSTAFEIGASDGEITVLDTSLLDFETTPTFTLTVEVEDSGMNTDSAEIVIDLTDVNEVPTVNEAIFSIQENSSVGTAVGTVSADDPEGPVTYEIISGNSSSAFAINSTSGEITVNNSTPLNFEATPTFNLTVRVTDNGTPTLPAQTNTAPITINLTDRNETPTVNDATFFISEGSSNGAVVGTVSASDPDAGDSLTYSITGSGNVGSVFTINPSSGQITVNDSTKLNADTMPIYNLTVQVLDSGNLPDTATITVNVTALPITYIYLPMVLNNYPPIEPNNNCSQAYGIGTNTTYEFTSDDQEDWYSFTITSQQNVSITLSGFEPVSGQLIVYGGTCSSLSLLQNNGSASSTKIINLNNLGAGTYFIRVFSAPVTNTPYNLRVDLN
ncbi:cadherin domain-containing protein [Candidatus Leptofilum sp.]|uniref:cadherin domain-containing protein n=1 Tax=Candidatus Leptofilum sp. TaxID=3241576 RepID=UPI003B598D3C